MTVRSLVTMTKLHATTNDAVFSRESVQNDMDQWYSNLPFLVYCNSTLFRPLWLVFP